MATRLVFLAMVCAGPLAFGEDPRPVVKQKSPVPVTAHSLSTAPGQKPPGKSPVTASPVTPQNYGSYAAGPVQPPATAVSPAPATGTPAPAATAEPPVTGMNIRFRMEGSFDVSFDMNVNQGQAKQPECPKARSKRK